jgi:hypothetical protein
VLALESPFERSVFNNLQGNTSTGFGKQHAEAGNLSMVVLPLIVADAALGDRDRRRGD